MQLVYTHEDMPETFTKSIFLAGGSLRPGQDKDAESWRKEAIKILEELKYDGVVFIPENRDNILDEDFNYSAQVEWEEKYLNLSDCILFWVPRDLSLDKNDKLKLPCFTTNIEWGHWADSGKVVFGAPKDAPKNDYIKYYAKKYKVPTSNSLHEALENALNKIGKGSERTNGERYVPLFVWNQPSFQSWYQQLKEAGNRLDSARLLYSFRPSYKEYVFLWILKVDVYVASEDRNKTNEFVLARPDISSILMWQPNKESIKDSKVILIKEFRSPAKTEDGFIRELPSGSSHNETDLAAEIASQEVHEETGIHIIASRFKFHSKRQLVATLSSHSSNLFSVELTNDELEYLEAQKDIAHGLAEDSEKTFVEIYTVRELFENKNIDFSNLGMILSLIYGD